MTELMGILNLTPDSFSGDGLLGNAGEALLARAHAMANEGAAVIDIGAESTRPGAVALSAEEEWQRVAPLAALLSQAPQLRFSIDSYHPENARRAVEAGFAWVNDVSGGSPAMLAVIAESNAQLVLMHSLSVPVDKAKTLPEDADVVAEVFAWGEKALAACKAAGIARDRVILDPGIGFGKTPAQSLTLIREMAKFKAWGVRLLVGHSRKSFLAPLVGEKRDEGTLAVSSYLALLGVDYLRVHDVAAHATLLKVTGTLQ